MKIQQGDQYTVPIEIRVDDTLITPENCVDIRVKVDKYMVSYDSGQGDLYYNSDDKVWCFPLTEEMSFKFSYSIPIQIGVSFGDDYLYSDTQQLPIGASIIREKWGEDE